MSSEEPQEPPGPSNGAQSSSAMRFWRQVASMTSIGWSMVLPIAGGALLGHYLDQRAGGGYVWTVGLLFGGIMVAFYNLYHILTKEIDE